MILSSWLTTVSNRIRNANARRRFSRKWKGNRFAQQPTSSIQHSPASFSRLSEQVRKAVWQTFDASPRWTSNSRRFQRQSWSTADFAQTTERLEDRTLLSSITFSTSTDQLVSGQRNQGWWSTTNSHSPTNSNYFTGFTNGGELRSFFSFNVAALPDDAEVTSATLRISQGGFFGGSHSGPLPSTVNLFDVTTSAAQLKQSSGFNTAIFNDLGSGTQYGTLNVTTSSRGALFSTNLSGSSFNAIESAGDGNNAGFFSIGGALRRQASTHFTFGGSGNAGTQVLTVNFIQPPQDIRLSSASINEEAVTNSVVGILSTSDPDGTGGTTFSLVGGAGSTDNGAFNINGNQLRANSSFDFEEKSSYSVRIRATDNAGLTREEAFTISVNDISETINLSVSPTTGAESTQTPVTVTATASSKVGGTKTVNVAVADMTTGDLTAGGVRASDFTLSDSTITIPNGQTTGTVTFTVVDDVLVEGTETATLTISNPSAGIVLGSTVAQNVAITDDDVALQDESDASNDGDTITRTAPDSSSLDALIAEVETLNTGGKNITVDLTVASGSYTGLDLDIPDGVTLILTGDGGTVTFTGASPALTHSSGNLIVSQMSFTTSTDDPTILVEGGSLTIRESFIEESTGFDQFAFQVTGGVLDLGTTGDVGSNSITIDGAGSLLSNLAGGAPTVSASGNWWGSNDETTISTGISGPVDFTPFLDNGTDVGGDSGNGFQGDFSALNVTVLGEQVSGVGRIQEGINAVTAAGTVNVGVGTFTENITLNKSVSLQGAQAGVDARGRAGTLDPAQSSIIAPAAGIGLNLTGGSAESTIDGFTFNGGNRGIESSSGPITGLQLLNNHIVGQSGSAVFLNDSGEDITVNQNVFVGSAASSTVFHLDTDNFDGLHFTNNDVLRTGNPQNSIGLFVDGNHNVGVSGTRTPLIQGNLFQGHGNGANLGTRAFDGGMIVENTFDSNESGLGFGIQNSTIARNTFSNNNRGLRFTSFGNMGADRGAQNNTVTNNVFTGNTTLDVFLAGNQLAGTIGTNTFSNNSFSAANAVQYDGDGSGNVIDFSRNWWGTSVATAVQAKVTGAGAASVDFTPFLNSGTDTDGGTAGFQGDFGSLHVTALGAQAGAVARIQEGFNTVTGAGTLNVQAGSYTETLAGTAGTFSLATGAIGNLAGSVAAAFNTPGGTVSPGAPGNGTLNVTGNTDLSNGTFSAGITSAADHDVLSVTGTVALGGAGNEATLTLSMAGATINDSDEIVLISNDGSDVVTGTFAGLAEGTVLTPGNSGWTDTRTARITYQGGAGGNDVSIVVDGPVVIPPATDGDPNTDEGLTIRRNGDNVEFVQNGVVVDSRPIASVGDITLNGSAGDSDVFTLDFSNGNPFGTGDVFVNGLGGAGTDSLVVTGGAFGTVVYNATNTDGTSGDGNIALDGSLITFTGLEPVDMTGSVITDLTINVDPMSMVAGAVTTTVAATGGTDTLISFDNGLESTTVRSITGTLTINGDNVDQDIFNVQSVGSSFAAGLTISGQGGANDEIHLQTGTGLTLAATKSLSLAAETIDQTGPVTVPGTTILNAGTTGTITLNDADNDFGGSVTITASGTTTIRDTNALTLSNSSTSGTTTLTAGTNLTLNNLNASGQTVSLTATAGSVIDGNGGTNNLTATSLTASAATGIDLDTTITTLTSATTTGSGAINISDSAGGLTATTVSSTDGSVTLNATGGDLTIGTSLSAGGNNDALLTTTTSGNVILTGTTTATANLVTITSAEAINGGGLVTAATIDLNAASGIGNTTALELAGTTISADTTTGNVDVGNTLATATTYTSISTDTGTITVDNSGGGTATFTSVTTDGNIDLENTGNDLTATSVVAGGTGNITLTTTTSGDVLVGLADAAGDQIDIMSAGAIEESGADADADIDARDMFLTAVTGIGASGQIEIDAFAGSGDGLRADVTGTGAINVLDESNLRVITATTADGAITIAADGELTVDTNVAAGGNSRNVTLTTNNGDRLTLTGTTTAAGDQVQINSNLDIQGSGLVTASVIDLNAASGIGSATVVELAGSTITADVANGGIDINNTLATAVSLSTMTTPNGSVRFDQSGGGDLTTGTVSATTSATLTNTAGAIALDGSVTSATLVVNASGAVSDGANGDLAITNNASITGGSITLGDTAGNATDFGSLTFNSAAGAVSISEDSSTLLTGTSTGDSLTLVSAGAVTDATNTDVTIDNGNASITGTSLSLADQATDTLSVSGTASLDGGAGAITVAAAGAVDFGSLTFNTTDGAVSITEDSDTELTGTSTGDSLTLVSAGAVTDATNTDVTIDNGNASITGTSISLTDQATDTLSVSGTAIFDGGAGAITVAAAGAVDFGNLTFNTTGGAVSITEDSDTELTGTSTSDSLTLVSAGAITDGSTSLAVTNLADFAGTAITVGGGATTSNFGTLTFNSTGAVVVQEDSSTALAGTNTALSLDLDSAGAITDGSTSLAVTNLADFAGTAITLGGAGIATNFGSLTADTSGANGNQDIQEDSDTSIVTMNAGGGTIALESAAAITDGLGGEAANVTAGSLAFRAVTGIGDAGTDDSDIDLTVGTLAATTATGDISLSNSVQSDVGTVDGLSGLEISTGGAGDDILYRVTATTDAQITQAVTNAGAGDITLALLGNDATWRVRSDVSASGGNVLITGQRFIFLEDSPTVETTGTGTIQIHAGQVFNFGAALTAGNAAGRIFDIGGNYVVQTEAGNITLTAPDLVQLSIVNADSDGMGAAGTVIVTADSDLSGGNGGGITNNGDFVTPNVTGAAAVFRAASGIGQTVDITTAVSDLAYSNTSMFNVQVTNAGGLTINTVDGLATSSNVGTGTTTLTASSPVTFAVNTSSGGNLTVNATESAAATDDITVNAGVTVQSTAGDVTFNAGDDIILTDNTSIVSATGANGDVTMNSGVADTDNVGIQTLNGQINANTTNGVVTLNLNADGSATQNANGRVTGTNLRLLSTGANGSFALATSANNDVDVIAASTTGAINFRDDDGVTVGTVTTVGITTTDDAVTIDSSQGAGGTVTVDQAITTAGTGTTGTVELSGDVDINASLTAAGGSITLRGVAGANSDIDVGAAVTSAASINWATNRDIIISATVQTTQATTDITLTADSDADGSGGVRIATAGQVNAVDELTITGSDLFASGGGAAPIDSVDIQQDGANAQVTAGGNIGIASGAAAAGNADIRVAGIVQSTGAGNVTINANNDLVITVDGDVTSAGGNLNLDGGQDVLIDSGVQVTTTGAGTIDIDAVRTISVTGVATLIQTVNGVLTLDANAGVSGDFHGIFVEDASITSTDGNITLTGTGGDGGGGANGGVVLFEDATVETFGTGVGAGTITLVGDAPGGNGGATNGVVIRNNSVVRAVDGDISVTGTSAVDEGVAIVRGAAVTSTGTGADAADITILGTANDPTRPGVVIILNSAAVETVDGDIDITGNGTAGGGVTIVDTGRVTSTGTGAGAGTITISGTATTLDGVRIATNGQVASSDGAVSITGTSTTSQDGVEIAAGSANPVVATNGATVAITGTGATGEVAVQIDSPISSGTGTITITALDGASATDDITFGAAGDITSTSGLISIDGDTATSNTADVTMADGAVINAGTGTVEIIADVNFTVGEVITSGLVNAAALAGSIIDADAGAGNDITAGSLAISGETGVGSDADAIETTVSTLAGRANSGDFNMSNTGNLDLGAVALAPLALGLFAPDTQVIGVTIEDSADDNSTNDNLTVVTSGSLTVSLGPDADGDNGGVDNNDGGNITLTANGATADLTISAPVNVSDGDGVQDGIGNIDVDAGRDVIINNDALVATDASGQIFVDAVRRIDVSSNAATTMIQSIDGAITMNANAAMTSTGEFFGIVIDDANITTSTGAITVTGVGGNSGNSNHGVRIQNGALVESTGNAAGTISIDGTGRAGVFSEGIRVADAATLIQSVDANIALTGVTASDNGVEVNEATVRTTGTGTIVIDGTSTGTVSSGTANNGSDGVLLAGSSALITTTGPGAATISISGQSAGDEGIELNSASVSTVGSLATISLSGSTTATGGSDSDGIHILGADARISSASGEISITGETNGGGTAGDGVEIAAGVTLAIDANGTAGITISGTGDGAESGVQINSPVESEMGAITIRSEDGGSTTDDITFGAGGDITSTSGLITIDADTATSNTADVFMANGAVINAGSGQIDIDADVNVTLGSIQTTSTADPAIEIDALAGAVIDGGDADIDIVTGAGGSVVIRSVTGIGSGDALETDLNASILAAINTTSGTIEIDDTGANTSLLTIGTVDGLAGITNQTPDGGNPSTTGFISVSNASPIDVVDNITANGDITLTTGDTDAINVDNLFIDDVDTLGNDLLIESTGGSITLNVGDDAVIEGDLTAASIITINIDQPGAAGDDAVVLTGGGTLDIRLDEAAGTAADAVLTTTGGTFINGGDEDDTFIFQAQSTTNFVVNGNPPAFGDAGVPPGDTLRLDFTNVVNPPILATGIPGAGVFSFQALPAPGDDELSVSYSNIETVDKVNGTVNYHLVIDPTLPGSYGNQTADPDDTRDDLTVRLNPDETGSGGPVAGTDLIIERTAAPGGDSGDFVGEIFRGTLADILSLTIQGTDDDETLTIDESNGLPSFNNAGGFAAVAPSTRGIDNSLREIWFNGSFSNSDLDLDNVDLNNLVINDSDLLSRDRGTTTLLEGPLSYTGATANTRSGGLTGTTTHAGAWVGAVTIGPAGGFADPLEEGVVTFGTESNDGSQFWVDLDQDGIFSRTGADGDELIVDNSAGATDVGGAPVSAVGTVDFSAGGLGAGVYSVAITYYTRTAGTEGIEARFAQGNVAYGAATVIDPSAAGQQGLWRSERLDNVHLTNADDGNDRAEFVFIGRGGTNAVVYNLGSANTVSQTYAIGDGLGGGDNAASGHSEGAILTRDDTNNESQLFYFTGLEPITVSGTAGGRLTILGDNEDNLINIEDDATTAGNTLITASTPATGSGVGTYESYSFAANTFANIDVFGMLGADLIDLIAMDANQNSSMIELNGDDTLDGDTSDDTIRVRSYPAGNMSSLFGGAGDDTFNIFDAANTVDGILGRMMIDGEGGTDTVIVDDSGSNPAGDDGETVTVNIPPGAPNLPGIDGIFGEGAGVNVMGTDIILANVTATAPGSVEVLTISTSADNDDINVDMNGVTATDLTTITINGSDGSDLFNIQSDTPSDATTNLNGNAGADQFFFEAGTFVVTGAIDGGADNDALDYSAYGSGRTIQLTAVGSTDGFQGNDATAGGTSIAPVAAASFDNIDILIGSSMDDTLIGADLRNHWDIGGDIDGFDDAHFNPTGGARTDGGLQLVNSLADAGVLIADESDLSLTGNATTVGRPTGANPIVPNAAGEQDLAFTDFQFFVGALTADDHFDLRDGASVTGTIDGRGGSDSIDYRDFTTAVLVDLNTGEATNVNVSGGGAGAGQAGGLEASGSSPDDNSIENAFGGDADDMIFGDDDNNILGDGFGNDLLIGDRAREGADPTGITSGDDTFRLEPRAGDNDIVFDLAGSDTVDFRFATQGIVYDADIVGSTATPFLQDVFNGAGATVDLRRNEDDGAGGIPQPATGNTPFENVVGTQFNDIIHIDPLSISGNFPTEIPVNRFVDGNDPFVGGPDDGIPPDPGDPIPPGDILRFDGKGAVVQDTGLSLTAQGVGTVAYRSIETITSFDDAPRIIDNGDDAVTTFPNTTRPGQNSATWNVISNVGFQDDYLFSVGAGVQGTDNPNIVTWTANGVADGLYRISLTWPDLGVQNGASSTVPVQIFDGDTLLATLSVNQRLAPSDLLDEGVFWDDLGIFNFQTHTARIVLSNDTEGTVLADAVRLEQISPNPELQVELQDTGEYIADGVDIVDVTTVIEQPQTRTFTVSNDGTADLMITDIELEQNGGTNWQLTTPLGTSFTLPPGQSTFVAVTLLATTANGQADYPAELRIFSNDVDENVLQLPGQGVNPDPDGDPLNDVNPFTIPLNGVVSTVDIIDDTDVRFDTVGVWDESGGLQSVPNSFGTGIKTAPNDGDGERALWTFSDLPDGRYRVSVTWPNEERLNLTTVEYRVRNSSATLSTTQVDQSVAPAGLNANGTTFQDLGGPFDITDGTIIVELRDTKIGTRDTLVAADAVRIERLFDTVADATLFDGGVGGTEVADDTGVVSFGTVLPGTQVQKTFTVRNDGMQDLTVREPVSLPAGYTLISFNGGAPTNATEVTLMPGQTVDFVVQLNASTAGVVSGEMSFATGELAGGANADPDENPINVTLTATVQSTIIVDNHDAGFSTTGNAFQLFLGGPQGYNSEGNKTIHIADANGTGDTAVWTIPVEPGGRYRIGATYTLAAGNGPTNAPYTVAGVVGGTTVPINQRVLPDDRFANGSAFEDLGVFVADGTGTITVTLADTGNGAAVADAIRVEALFGPEIEVLDNTSGTNLQDGASTVDFGDTTQGSGALSRTFTITNDGERELALGTISLPNNFQLAGTFPTSIAANGGTGTFTLQLTTADAGTFGGVVSFTNDDADESPFNFDVTGTVIGAAPVIIDNGDAGFSSVGLFNSQSNGGRNGTYFQALNGDGSSVATWQFTGLAAGVYNVAATWGGYFIRATNAPYTITDSTGSTTVEVNQRLDPDDFTENFMGITASWENLGQSFVVDGTGTLTVTLSNLADNYVYADAIRVERTGDLPEIVVTDLGPDQVAGGGNDVNLPDGGTFDFGSVTPGVPVTRTFQITNAGTATLTTGTLTLPSGFSTTYTPQTLAASGTATFDVTYDALADATGTFSFPTNDDDESPFNFTLTGSVAATVTVIDDGDGGFMTPTGGFSTVTTQNNEGFQGDIRTATGDASGNTATWTFSGLTVGGTYRVSSTWFPFFNRATDAPFTISGIDGGPLTVDVNQRLIPGSFTESGEDWLDLELVRVAAGGQITVTLSDDADGLVVADAIRVEQVVGNDPEIVVHNGGLVIADGSTFDFGTVGQNGTLSQTFTVVNSGQTDLTVQTPILPPGFTTPFTTTTIAAGDTADIVVSVSTSEQANLSGAMSISSNDGNESPFNLNLQATVEGPTPTIIDNGDVGFAAAGGFSAFNGQGFRGDVHFVNGGTPGATATYSFTGLADGQYLVSTTWTPLSDRASDAPYTVTDSVNGGVTIDISQRNAPDDFNADGVSWEELGIFTVSGGAGTITVGLTGDADNIVIADAVRLDPVVGAEITVLEGSTVISLGGTLDFGDVVQGTANVTRTITVRNDGPEDLILQPIPALTGFTISNSNFTAGQMLATGATASFDITIDTASLGTLTDELEFSNNDADEGPFRFTVTGNIVADVIVPLVIDNGDATGYTQVGDFTLLNGPGFLNDTVQDTTPNAGGGMATWTFTDLDAGTYRVSATWDAFYAYPQASNAPFTISGIDGGPVTVNIDQRVNPDDFTFQGEAFEDLGVFTLSGSTITVSLSDMADGSVLADAIRIEQITGSDITVAQGGTDLLSGSSTVAFDSQVEGGTGESITFTVSNVGPANLVLQPVVVGAGFVVTDNFTAGDMVATSATDTFTIQLDTSTPGDFSATVSLPSNDPDENPFVFTVTGTVTMNTQPLIIDNNDAGFSSTPNFVTMGGQGYNATVLQSDNTDAGVATWTFTGLPAGTYRVGATWTTAFDLRATDAMYSIAGGAAIVVNQRQHPVQSGRPFVLDGGSIFADLDGGYAHAGGDLTITLSDTPTGVVIADAIRLERLAPLQVRGGQVTPAAEVEEIDQQDAGVEEIFQTAVDIWASTQLTEEQSGLLSTVTFHVRDLTDGHLGAASNHAVFLDINGAGYGWFVDSTPLMSEEFELVGGELVAVPGGPADGQIDLLTVVLHELGHVIGLEDLSAVQDENDLMFRDIVAGLRRLPGDHGSSSTSTLPVPGPSVDLTSGGEASDGLNGLLQTPLIGSQTPAELYADRKDDEADEQTTPGDFSRVEQDDTNGIDNIFTLLTEEDALSSQNPFDEI